MQARISRVFLLLKAQNKGKRSLESNVCYRYILYVNLFFLYEVAILSVRQGCSIIYALLFGSGLEKGVLSHIVIKFQV